MSSKRRKCTKSKRHPSKKLSSKPILQWLPVLIYRMILQTPELSIHGNSPLACTCEFATSDRRFGCDWKRYVIQRPFGLGTVSLSNVVDSIGGRKSFMIRPLYCTSHILSLDWWWTYPTPTLWKSLQLLALVDARLLRWWPEATIIETSVLSIRNSHDNRNLLCKIVGTLLN